MSNDFYVGYYEDHYLAHHGILGQKWGRKNGPPYPLEPKDHSASEKKAGWTTSLKEKHAEKKRKKQQTAALEKARAARAEKAKQAQLEKEYEEKKQQVLRSGKASEILKYKGQMTNQEMNDAINRIGYEERLYGLAAKEEKTTWEKIDNAMKKVEDITNWADKAYRGYETIEKIMKKVNGTEDNSEENKKKLRENTEKAIKSANLDIINKYKSEMSAKELNSALDKITAEKQLKKLIDEAAEEEKEKKKKG